MAIPTGGDLHVLCYQHHTEMSSKSHERSPEPLVYACSELGCLVHYESVRGYFLDTDDRVTLDQEILPGVRCQTDQRPMYLAEVRAQPRSFRLWKCPQYGGTRTNEESLNEFAMKRGA